MRRFEESNDCLPTAYLAFLHSVVQHKSVRQCIGAFLLYTLFAMSMDMGIVAPDEVDLRGDLP